MAADSTTTTHHHLFGACACSRNQYTVLIPSASAPRAQVFFDNSALSRRAQASPVTAWLRVPLSWYTSTTTAHFPDETPTSIKRTFHTPPSRRQFCGYCGSHLTLWHEQAHDSLDVTLGSLLSESLQELEALQILPDEAETSSVPRYRGMAFFEDLVENSRLWRVGAREEGKDRGSVVQWEIVEIAASGSPPPAEVVVVGAAGGNGNKRPRLNSENV